jgi:hypothetical protein
VARGQSHKLPALAGEEYTTAEEQRAGTSLPSSVMKSRRLK